MAAGKVLNGKPNTGNLRMLSEVGDVASVATPRRRTLLLCKRWLMKFMLVASMAVLYFCIGRAMSHVGWFEWPLNAQDDALPVFSPIYLLCTVAGVFLLVMLLSQRKRKRCAMIFSACLSAFIFCLIMVVCTIVMRTRNQVREIMIMTIFGVFTIAWFASIISLVRNKMVLPAILVAIGFVCSVPNLIKGAIFCGTGLDRYLDRRQEISMSGRMVAAPGHWVTGCGCCGKCTIQCFVTDNDAVLDDPRDCTGKCSGCKHDCGCQCKHRPCYPAFGRCTMYKR